MTTAMPVKTLFKSFDDHQNASSLPEYTIEYIPDQLARSIKAAREQIEVDE